MNHLNGLPNINNPWINAHNPLGEPASSIIWAHVPIGDTGHVEVWDSFELDADDPRTPEDRLLTLGRQGLGLPLSPFASLASCVSDTVVFTTYLADPISLDKYSGLTASDKPPQQTFYYNLHRNNGARTIHIIRDAARKRLEKVVRPETTKSSDGKVMGSIIHQPSGLQSDKLV